ncbi:MAG: hypothetical protein PF495_15010 [Spirochaetales bacterium]|jgi:hypothetical protein|nr:hypothetical protein [Spirochaetales bacterium]
MHLKILGCLVFLVLLAGGAQAESSFDRELVVKNQARAAKVEQVLKELLRAYENEDAREFLDYVSEDRFRQDYLTFTDALYEDFRTYEIHRVDYWLDRVVADHVKQFLYVKWEKRYESLDDARQLNETGFSRFVFDEVNGKYLLIELAGNDLFGASLPEWTEETPSIAGQEVAVSGNSNTPTGLPDLYMACSYFDQAGGNFQVVIQNGGTASSGPGSMVVTGKGGTITRSIPAIASGATHTDTFAGAGYSSPEYVLDSTNVITESDETNNSGHFSEAVPCFAF